MISWNDCYKENRKREEGRERKEGKDGGKEKIVPNKCSILEIKNNTPPGGGGACL